MFIRSESVVLDEKEERFSYKTVYLVWNSLLTVQTLCDYLIVFVFMGLYSYGYLTGEVVLVFGTIQSGLFLYQVIAKKDDFKAVRNVVTWNIFYISFSCLAIFLDIVYSFISPASFCVPPAMPNSATDQAVTADPTTTSVDTTTTTAVTSLASKVSKPDTTGMPSCDGYWVRIYTYWILFLLVRVVIWTWCLERMRLYAMALQAKANV